MSGASLLTMSFDGTMSEQMMEGGLRMQITRDTRIRRDKSEGHDSASGWNECL